MGDKLHQISVSFAPVEDRVLLRVSTNQSSGYRFWLTRRFVKLLQVGLSNIREKFSTLQHFQEPERKQALMDFQQAEAKQQGDFSTHYEEKKLEFPLGETPILLTGFKCNLLDGDVTQLVLRLHDERSFSVNLERQVMLNFLSLLHDISLKAEWGLNVQQSTPALNPQEESKDKRLH